MHPLGTSSGAPSGTMIARSHVPPLADSTASSRSPEPVDEPVEEDELDLDDFDFDVMVRRQEELYRWIGRRTRS